ncbi:MAG: alkaline phosphatase family protein, partial [Acidimicrobiales bacterium]
SDLPSSGVWLPLLSEPAIQAHIEKIDQFYSDAAAGRLPQFTFIDPNYSHSSEENPQDIQFGDQFLGGVVNAVLHSPQWPKTMLIWTYDEWGGWYDHVLPPRAIPPDDVPPQLTANQVAGGFNRYGFRVPGGVVSPYARRDFVSHAVYDHTSVLKTLERKWNLPAFTQRDANANDLFAMLDLQGRPAFAKPPRLPATANPGRSERCLTTGPGRIPPKSAVRRGAVPHTPSISLDALPAGTIGVPYSVVLESTPGTGAERWSVLSDDLPGGLVLDPRTGSISGVPTSSGKFGLTIGVQFGAGPVGSRSYQVNVAS